MNSRYDISTTDGGLSQNPTENKIAEKQHHIYVVQLGPNVWWTSYLRAVALIHCP